MEIQLVSALEFFFVPGKNSPIYIVLYMSQRYFSDMYPIIFFYNIYDMSKGHKTVQKTNKNYFFELIFPALESKLNAFN